MEQTSARSGRIITFYSYKGGTGRSMAIANIAWILASNGRKVLVIDWDFEAPGLHRYFHPFLEDKELETSCGLIDYFVDFATEAHAAQPAANGDARWYERFTDLVGYSRSLDWDFGDGFLDFVPAGRQAPGYAVRVAQFNWEEFYFTLGGGILLEALKKRLRQEYDYILVDSRTGVSDTSGICTVQMPDDLVVCFTLNRQSIAGASAVAQSAISQRRKPTGEPGLRVWPVPMRVEMAEKERLERARDLARETFLPCLRLNGLLSRSDRELYWGSVEVLYHPFYAYEEVLAAFADRRHQTGSLLASLEQIARRISDVRTLGEMSESDRLRGLAGYVRPRPIVSAPRSRIFVCYRRKDSAYVERLGRHLNDRFGSESVFIDAVSIELGANWKQAIDEAIKNCQVFLAVIGPGFISEGPSEYYVEQLRLAHETNRRIIPVLVGDARFPQAKDLAPDIEWLTLLNGLVLNEETYERDVRKLTDGIVRLEAETPAPGAVDPDDPQKGQWGGRAAANGRVVTGTVKEVSAKWFEIALSVTSTLPTPLEQPVIFHLHPTFVPSVRTVQPSNGVANLTLQAYGTFTVGVSTDDGRTRLELDLSTISGAPQWFLDH